MSEAVFGLAGVFVGAMLTWLKEGWSERQTRTRRARYLAIRVVCLLDGYIERCVEVVQDGGSQSADGSLEPEAETPGAPVYPEDVDWKSIDHELMYHLLVLPSEAEAADRLIGFTASVVSGPPDYEEVFEERHYQYARLGLRASGLVGKLRQEYGIPESALGDWDPEEYLRKRQEEIESAREARLARREAVGG